jgi:hypothetical protein
MPSQETADILQVGDGIEGMLGIPAATNLPSARTVATTWKDSAGNFWLCGGFGVYPTYPFAPALADSWTYSPTTNEWTWMGACSIQGANASGWTDTSGHVWLLGGFYVTSPGSIYTGVPATLWEFSP